MKSKPPTLAARFANVFGALGYMSTLTQWLWTGILVAYPLLTKERLNALLPEASTPVQTSTVAIDYGSFTPVITILAIAASLLIVTMSIYLLIKLPSQIGKKGQQLTKATATGVLPVVRRHPLNKKQRKRLIDRITWWVKIVFILLPIAGLLFASSDTGMSKTVIMIIGALCAFWTSFCFLVQFVIAKLYRLQAETIW